MEMDRAAYPTLDAVPSQTPRIHDRDWDVLLVFDACRWDALDDVVSTRTDHDVEMVRTPTTEGTPGWVAETWDCAGWDDVTYLSANPFTTLTRDIDQFGTNLDERMGDYRRVYDYGYDDHLNCAPPQNTTIAASRVEPPMVVHYLQPHVPFIGNLSVHAPADGDHPVVPEHDDDPDDPLTGRAGAYRLADAGHLSTAYIRHAYYDNLKLVWKASQRLRETHDDVVVTSDHGTRLGPDRWDHGAPGDPRMRLVPWLEL